MGDVLNKKFKKKSAIYATLVPLFSGCTGTGQAPDFLILNSYFPSWLVGALVAMVITVCIRVLLIKLDLDDYLPFRFFVYTALWLSISIVFTYIYSPR
ncbi:hypothetical protein AS359_10685 [Comamonas kerstersii]|uniref:Uncharacterized protein YtcA n=1 Tax=Comamonas kerstersii TaxID=225992 RepID=A0A0W7Z201_9BURK|nr:hypothetical protein AS359_10685 [Comamonas kerstersii]